MSKPRIGGVYCAAVTPLDAELSPDLARFVAHCHRLLDAGCHGVALLGTTGEANSFSLAERRAILEAAVAGGVDPARLMPGTGLCALADTIELTRHALSLGVTRVVMLPPFYYKGVAEDGLYAAYAHVLDAVADDRLEVVLYHIPQVSGVPIGHGLIARLIAAYPDTVVGIKDSAGDLANMAAIAAAHPGFAVLAGADPLLLPLLGLGGAGCITATSNLVGDSLRTVYDHHADPAAADRVAAAQARIEAWRNLSNSYVQIPAIKAMVAATTGEDGLARVRPPLVALDAAARAALAAKLETLP
ncbi:dihydrodipicolinate synthase family protein [Oharaeibacter diazotrophicus]|uniref:4-hydroxy-tetrahydrodipicolinate synthase n=1 Tax=Oharaeibacter diazotrophicus TaxID=1920512 RepID=A0A4R6R5F9_9HYPH|nr:dihydrodipicolinate synthase family protein [Oharaeibacter diazotrophicus]TDP81171.1 4-hydroxy-tetrahydrodipicolinate synthase [Oharaeibacter diazotrophicus]BBE74835.1 4-hydroxy-tetrahydrodipicolinate synthase [Pleomorphomonas sp. SM30]GLS75661.1 dihydrodipicolinate synthase family protein [Oharaeibacter diazotrophicus]